jgi:hypothetical protein
MAERRWTVLVVPHGSGASRAVEISQGVVKAFLGMGAVLVLGFGLLSVATLSRGVMVSAASRLAGENTRLADELALMERRLGTLSDTVEALTRRDEELRLLAGLPRTDPAVLEAGIGGPSGAWAERDSLVETGETGRRAVEARRDLDALIRRANLLAASIAEAGDSLEHHTARLAATPSIMPTPGFFSSPFARARIHPIFHEARPHEGIDVSAYRGTPIVAPASGVVVQVNQQPGYGQVVAIDHGMGIVTKYAHCEKVLVRRGQRVKRGDQIATVGSTGITTGPHLHYEVWKNGRAEDPKRYIFAESIVD